MPTRPDRHEVCNRIIGYLRNRIKEAEGHIDKLVVVGGMNESRDSDQRKRWSTASGEAMEFVRKGH